MENPSTPIPIDEQALVKLYLELTGATDSSARGVFMYVQLLEEDRSEDGKAPPQQLGVHRGPNR